MQKSLKATVSDDRTAAFFTEREHDDEEYHAPAARPFRRHTIDGCEKKILFHCVFLC